LSFDWWNQLDRIECKLDALFKQEADEMSALDDLKAQVQKNSDVEESAVLLIQGIAKQLADAIAAGDPAALTALQAQLAKSAGDLAAAITANTSAAL
jgi:hypothetical protein